MDRARSAAVDYLGNTAFRRFVGDVGFELMRMAQAEGDDAVVARLAGLFLDRVRAQPDLEEAPKLVFLAGSNLIALDDLPALRAQFEPFAAQFPESSFTDGALYWLGKRVVIRGISNPSNVASSGINTEGGVGFSPFFFFGAPPP